MLSSHEIQFRDEPVNLLPFRWSVGTRAIILHTRLFFHVHGLGITSGGSSIVTHRSLASLVFDDLRSLLFSELSFPQFS
jgi:hypothetical protein